MESDAVYFLMGLGTLNEWKISWLPPPQHIHIPSPTSTDTRTVTRTKHPVRRNVDLNAGERKTEVTCYGIMIS